MQNKYKPKEIIEFSDTTLMVVWEDGHESISPARFLRLACPCAVCVDEVSGAPLLDPTSVTEDVHPSSLELVGHYAIQPRFSDGHFTGIFSFELLRGLCPCKECRT